MPFELSFCKNTASNAAIDIIRQIVHLQNVFLPLQSTRIYRVALHMGNRVPSACMEIKKRNPETEILHCRPYNFTCILKPVYSESGDDRLGNQSG